MSVRFMWNGGQIVLLQDDVTPIYYVPSTTTTNGTHTCIWCGEVMLLAENTNYCRNCGREIKVKK